jgi:hypothetical protein
MLATPSLEQKIIRRISHSLDQKYPCIVNRNLAIHFRHIPGLVITAHEDRDSLHSLLATYRGRNGLITEHFALDELDRLLDYVNICSMAEGIKPVEDRHLATMEPYTES